jgi:nucleotide-binding universal stress UspA family protein
MDTTRSEQAAHEIVVGVDYSELGDLALERACSLARTGHRARLHVVHVATRGASSPEDHEAGGQAGDASRASKQLYAHVEGILRKWRDKTGLPVPFERLTTHVRSGDPAQAIAQLAADVQAELVLVGTHGQRGARRFLLGSVAEGTVRLAPCAVVVVRESDVVAPGIVPPCPRCLATRQATGGREFWCEQHREHHERRHTYHYTTTGTDAHQSGFLIHME